MPGGNLTRAGESWNRPKGCPDTGQARRTGELTPGTWPGAPFRNPRNIDRISRMVMEYAQLLGSRLPAA
jgi:hypothetical protein